MILCLLLACASGPPDPEQSSPPIQAAPTCEQAHEELASLATAVPDSKSTSRARFLRACAMLPKDVQPCMSMRWSANHTESCMASIDGLPDDLRDELKQLLEG